MAFSVLSPKVQSLVSKRGFKATNVQQKAIPFICSGKNVLVIAETGMGKTEAALLPVLDQVVGTKSPAIDILYVTPLRALNRDMLR